MSDENNSIALEPVRGRGRPVGSKDRWKRGPYLTGKELWTRLERLQTLGVIEGTSARVLAALDADDYWLRLISEMEKEKNWNALAEVVKFHQQMRDGRPSQRIQLTSTNINLSADDLTKIRGAVRELRVLPGEAFTDAETKPNVAAKEGVKKDGE